MKDRNLWKPICLITLLIISLSMPSVLLAQDDLDTDSAPLKDQDTAQWYAVEGYSSEGKEFAVREGYFTAMLEFLQNNLTSKQYEANEKKIKTFLRTNVNKFKFGSPSRVRAKRGEEGTYTMRVKLKEEKLMAEVRQKFLVTAEVLKGMEAVLLSETEGGAKLQDEWKDRDVLFDGIQEEVQAFMPIKNMKNLRNMMELEAKATGRSVWANPEDYFQEQLDIVRLQVYLWVTTKSFTDPRQHAPQQIVQVRCRGVWRQTGDDLWMFSVPSEEDLREGKASPVSSELLGDREARARSIRQMAKLVASKINQHVRTNLDILDTYILRFVRFNDDSKRGIDRALSKASRTKNAPIKVLRGGSSQSAAYWTMKVRWLKGGELDRVRDYIIERCENEEVSIKADKWSTGVIWFMPGPSSE